MLALNAQFALVVMLTKRANVLCLRKKFGAVYVTTVMVHVFIVSMVIFWHKTVHANQLNKMDVYNLNPISNVRCVPNEPW